MFTKMEDLRRGEECLKSWEELRCGKSAHSDGRVAEWRRVSTKLGRVAERGILSTEMEELRRERGKGST